MGGTHLDEIIQRAGPTLVESDERRRLLGLALVLGLARERERLLGELGLDDDRLVGALEARERVEDERRDRAALDRLDRRVLVGEELDELGDVRLEEDGPVLADVLEDARRARRKLGRVVARRAREAPQELRDARAVDERVAREADEGLERRAAALAVRELLDALDEVARVLDVGAQVGLRVEERAQLAVQLGDVLRRERHEVLGRLGRVGQVACEQGACAPASARSARVACVGDEEGGRDALAMVRMARLRKPLMRSAWLLSSTMPDCARTGRSRQFDYAP